MHCGRREAKSQGQDGTTICTKGRQAYQMKSKTCCITLVHRLKRDKSDIYPQRSPSLPQRRSLFTLQIATLNPSTYAWTPFLPPTSSPTLNPKKPPGPLPQPSLQKPLRLGPPLQSPFSKTFLLSTHFPHHQFHSVACFPTPSKPLAFSSSSVTASTQPPTLFHTSTLVHLVLQTDLLPVDPCTSRLRPPAALGVGRGVFWAGARSQGSRVRAFPGFKTLLPPRWNSQLVARSNLIYTWVSTSPACKSRLFTGIFPPRALFSFLPRSDTFSD